MMRYLSETPEFKRFVEQRKCEAEQRKRAAEQRKCWPLRVLHAWIDGYLSELDHMLTAPSLAPWR